MGQQTLQAGGGDLGSNREDLINHQFINITRKRAEREEVRTWIAKCLGGVV